MEDSYLVTFKISKEEVERFQRIVQRKQLSRSALLRRFMIDSNLEEDKLEEEIRKKHQ